MGESENVEVFHMRHQITTIGPENNKFDLTEENKNNQKLSK